MGEALLFLPGDVHDALWAHILREGSDTEEAAFIYCRHQVAGDANRFHCLEWFPVPESGFASRSEYHFELTDETRATVIKRAHDLDACLVEFHSHSGPWPAAFSASDLLGFEEFVPHVRWRLKKRPYLAVVVADSGFDGLVWTNGSDEPERLHGILVDGKIFLATGLSPLRFERDDDERAF